MMSPLAMRTTHDLMADALIDHTFLMSDTLIPASTFRLNRDKPRVEASENGYTISVRAPGVAASDLKVKAEEGHIVMRGETKTDHHTHVVNYAVRLPRDANGDEASAACTDGLITVHVPKKEVQTTTIEVTSTDIADTTPTDDEPRPYKLTLVAAGVTATDLEVTAKDGTLKIFGETKRTGARVMERYCLPEDADA